MNLGYKQQALINLGNKKGSVRIQDVFQFYRNRETAIERMSSLVMLGFFNKPIEKPYGMEWEIKNGKN